MFVGSRTEWTSNPERARLFQHCSDAVDFCLTQRDPRLQVVLILEKLRAVCVVEPSTVIRIAWRAVAPEAVVEGSVRPRGAQSRAPMQRC
jgi:hypothetical protein